jgi:hypothetical protein
MKLLAGAIPVIRLLGIVGLSAGAPALYRLSVYLSAVRVRRWPPEVTASVYRGRAEVVAQRSAWSCRCLQLSHRACRSRPTN